MTITLPLDQMTLEEKWDAIEAIWESLARDCDALESPAWHREVLQERERQVEAGETDFISWEEAQENLRRRAADDRS